jgi:hypothetical protein
MKTIYVSLATLDDSETQIAIDNLFKNAAYPERIHVGLVVINKKEKEYKKYKKNNKDKNVSLKYVKLVTDILGTGFGRYHAQSMYNNEDYFPLKRNYFYSLRKIIILLRRGCIV